MKKKLLFLMAEWLINEYTYTHVLTLRVERIRRRVTVERPGMKGEKGS